MQHAIFEIVLLAGIYDWSPLSLSLKIAFFAVPIVFFAGTLLGWFAAGVKTSFVNIIDILLTLPLILPPTVTGFALLWIFGTKSFIGRSLQQMGLNMIFTWQAAVLAATIAAIPLMYRSAKAAFEQIDGNLIAAARTLGMSELKILLVIQVPLAKPGLKSGLILAFARGLGEFGATVMISGSIPGKTRTLPIAVYDAVQQGDWHQAMIWSAMLFLLSISLILISNRKTAEVKI